jgi:hypothetical protein
MTRAFVVVAALLAIGVVEPDVAQASGGGLGLSLESDAGGAAALLGLSAIGFGALDIAFFAAGRPLPVGLSILQIGLAGVLVPLLSLSAHDSAVAIGAFVSMAWFSGHGIHELVVYPEYARRRRAEVAAMRGQRCAVEGCPE